MKGSLIQDPWIPAGFYSSIKDSSIKFFPSKNPQSNNSPSKFPQSNNSPSKFPQSKITQSNIPKPKITNQRLPNQIFPNKTFPNQRFPDKMFPNIPQLRVPGSELRPGSGLLLDPRQRLHPPSLPAPPQVHR